jgi:UDP-N-acetylmuramoyl-L-alanyl-D-glutamate--2,6-diaminopimelate ligase
MKRMLSELIPDIAIPLDLVVNGITDDSRRVEPGDLFIATQGLSNDGRNFIPEAIAKSAAAVFCEPPAPMQTRDLPIVEVPGLGVCKGEIASRFYGMPSEQMLVVAVTGTNGKTSCSQFIAMALNAIGRKCGVIGTLGSGIPNELEDPGLTTPDAISLQAKLASLLADQCDSVTIEASSHGLSQGRLNGTGIDIAVFTNISRDHLDYHDTFGDYKRAKQSLFKWPGLKGAIINLDDDYAEDIIKSLASDVRVITYGAQNRAADVHCESLLFRSDGFEANVVTPWGEGEVSANLLGDFNVNNLLVVLAVLGVLEKDMTVAMALVGQLPTVPGRMEILRQTGFPLVVIDYAHTPDALEKALMALRRHCIGKLWCVVGCGGDRDRGKRPQMGKIVAGVADKGVITDDNPRSEPSGKIIEDILAEVDDLSNIHIEPDRATAIEYALGQAGPDDIVLIAGKGHEEYQIVGGKRHVFSDQAEVRKHFGER